MLKKLPLYLMAALVVTVVVTSCNKNSDDTTSSTVYSVSNSSALVKKFVLTANTKVMANLDSVYFTVDPDRRLIYNADSLPVGTNVSALLTTVTFANTVSSATYAITGATAHKDTTIVYKSSSSDSIDFTGRVTLTVVSSDKSYEQTYEVKVNVHQVKPDSMTWSRQRRRDLPGVTTTPLEQKTVHQSDTYWCMLNDGGNYVLSSAENPGQGSWDKQSLSLPFIPVVDSFNATSDALYVLDTEGNLYTSTDGSQWTDCGVAWHGIVGAYGDKLLGVLNDGGTYRHDEYPSDESFARPAVNSGFPVAGFSQLVTVTNSWSVGSQVLMMGGITAAGTATSRVWGYDGTGWAVISDSAVLPALSNATFFNYYSYYTDPNTFKVTQNPTWFVMGGKKSDGTLNTVVYASTDQGITWAEAAAGFQLPDYIPSFHSAQALLYSSTLTSSSRAPRRAAPDQPITSWECPYVYLFGGVSASGVLQNNVWCGVLNRMTFKPLY